MEAQGHDFLLPTVLVLLTVLLVFGMRYASGAWQARLRLADEGRFRSLAERTEAAQAATAASLATAQAELSDVRARLASIEKMLREVG